MLTYTVAALLSLYPLHLCVSALSYLLQVRNR